MADDAPVSKIRSFLRTFIAWLFGGVITMVFLLGMLLLGVIEAPENYWVRDALTESRNNLVLAWALGLGQTIAFGARWLETDAERSHHPVLVGIATGLTLLVLLIVFPGDDDLLAVASFLGTFPAALLAVQIRPATTPIARRAWVLLGSAVVSTIVCAAASPRAFDFPSDAPAHERHEWASENVGEPYVAAVDWAANCSALERRLGGPLLVAPVKHGDFRVGLESDGAGVTIDLLVTGANESATCRFDHSVDLPGGGVRSDADFVAECALPDVEAFRLPADCDCSHCGFDCDDPASVLFPRGEVVPANVPRLLGFDRMQTCGSTDRMPCDVSTRPDTSNLRLLRIDVEPPEVVVDEIRSTELFELVLELPAPLVEGAHYRAEWDDTFCGPGSLEFTAGPPAPLSAKLAVEPTDAPNVIRVEIDTHVVWSDSFTLKVDDDYVFLYEPVTLPCDEPGPASVTLRATSDYDPRLEAVTDYQYECPGHSAGP